MKVNPEQIRALQEAEAAQKARQAKEGDSSFGDLLAQEVANGAQGASDAVSAASPLAPPLNANALLNIGAINAVGDTNEAGQQVMAKLEGILSEWENYAARLEAPDGQVSLRGADDSLRDIESGVQDIREAWPGLHKDDPELNSVVDELEIMAVTERFKFNRGDYLE